jgi:hypothetical protein
LIALRANHSLVFTKGFRNVDPVGCELPATALAKTNVVFALFVGHLMPPDKAAEGETYEASRP